MPAFRVAPFFGAFLAILSLTSRGKSATSCFIQFDPSLQLMSSRPERYRK